MPRPQYVSPEYLDRISSDRIHALEGCRMNHRIDAIEGKVESRHIPDISKAIVNSRTPNGLIHPRLLQLVPAEDDKPVVCFREKVSHKGMAQRASASRNQDTHAIRSSYLSSMNGKPYPSALKRLHEFRPNNTVSPGFTSSPHLS